LNTVTEQHKDSLGRLIAHVETLAAAHPDIAHVTLGELLGAIGRRAYGPLLLAIGLFSISPATIVPGLTWASASATLVLAAQMMIGARHPWLPRRVLALSVSRRAVRAAAAILLAGAAYAAM
jgi:hypothetical protein